MIIMMMMMMMNLLLIITVKGQPGAPPAALRGARATRRVRRGEPLRVGHLRRRGRTDQWRSVEPKRGVSKPTTV